MSLKNLPMVTSSLYDDVTAKHFLDKIFYFKVHKQHIVALQMILDMWQTMLAVQL